MPSRLRPTSPVAADAILVGDPGRALLLAQELLEQPKMSNHARGLWGYSGRGAEGGELTIQATGMGGPSAAIVLADLAKLGVRRAIRIGTCSAVGAGAAVGELLITVEAVALGGSSAAFGVEVGAVVAPDPELSDRLGAELGEAARAVRVGSFDSLPEIDGAETGIAAADLQTVAVLAQGRRLGVAAAALLIVAETPAGERLGDEPVEAAAKLAGGAASTVLST